MLNKGIIYVKMGLTSCPQQIMSIGRSDWCGVEGRPHWV
jgi:hypothetical protein